MNKLAVVVSLLAMLLVGNIATAESPEPTVSWEQAVTTRVEATFQHRRGQTPLYVSRWIGTINVVVAPGLDKSLQAEFRVGLGESRGLSSQWLAIAKEGEFATGATKSIPIYLTAPNVSGEHLRAWRSVQNTTNPALVVPLVPRTDKPGYTNAKAVHGRVFLWDESGERPEYARYAEFAVPANGFALEATQGSNNDTNIRFLMSDVRLERVSQHLWRRILADGNAHVGIGNAVGATSGWIYGDSSQQELDRQRPADNLDVLFGSLESIYAEKVLPIDQVAGMTEKLNVIAMETDRWQPMQNSSPLIDFDRTVKTLAKEGKLLVADAGFLLSESNAFLSATAALGSPGFAVGSSVDYEPSTPEERTHFHVDERSDCTPATGSVECPFPSIAAALAEAAATDLIGVELDVESGVYRHSLFITRDTIIRSTESSGLAVVIAATMKNHTPAYLKLEGVTLRGGEPDGALTVSNDEAITVVTGVRVESAERFGITHSGGELWLTNVEIHGTRTTAGFPWHGTGLTITNGAVAVLDHVRIVDNESSGILADGEGTYLWGVDVELRGNRLNPFHVPDEPIIPSFVGALNVRGGALVDLRAVRVDDNEFIGVFVEEGGQAMISDAVIEGTYPVTTPDLVELGGVGVGAKTGGHLELWDFSINDNDILGVAVFSEGTVVLHDGEVMRNPVGAWISTQDPPYDIETLRDNVRWDNYDIDIQTEWTYVPIGTPQF